MIPRAGTVQAAACTELQTLHSIAEELSRRLGMTVDALRCDAPPIRIVKSCDQGLAELAVVARRYLRARRLREAALGPDLFADPCWDLMLDLFASQAEGKPVSVSSACIASNVPPTTALRWLARLEEVGLVRRYADPRDGRRAFLTLSELASQAVGVWIEATFSSDEMFPRCCDCAQ